MREPQKKTVSKGSGTPRVELWQPVVEINTLLRIWISREPTKEILGFDVGTGIVGLFDVQTGSRFVFS